MLDLKAQFNRIKKYFSSDIEKSTSNVNDTISKYREEKVIVKSLFDNDMIDLDEYIEKIKILDENIKDTILKDTTVYNYADAIIRNGEGNILFLRRNSNDALFPDYWGLPGGKIEEGESPEDAVKRETLEETSKVVLESFLVAKKKLTNGGLIHYFECCVKNIDGDIILNNDEHYSYQFINKHDYNKFNFIEDLLNVLNQIEERYKVKVENNALVIKAENHVGTFNIKGIEFVTEDKGKKYTSLKKLVDDGEVDEKYFMHYLQTVNNLPDSVQPGDFNLKNQTQLSDKASKDEELKRAEKVDLITMPKNITGVNCGNCMYFNSSNSQCVNKEVDQKVTDKMCCSLWDAEGTNRAWKKENVS